MRDSLMHVVASRKSVDEAVAALESKVAEKGFRVLGVHDVRGMLAEKGFRRGEMKIVEF